MGWVDVLAGLAIGYLLGAVPFGLLLTRAVGGGDLRSIGSGNIGATNVLRTGRRWLAAATLVLDAGKGAAAVFAAPWLVGLAHGAPPAGTALAAALGAMLGHCFPVWLDFRGGKGVATLLGIATALSWPAGVAFAVIWCAMLAATRISSVAGMSAAAAMPVAALALGEPAVAGVLALCAALVIWRHRANIARLRAGTEPRVGKRAANDDR